MLNGAVYSLNYDLLNGFAPISPLANGPFLLYATKTVPAGDLTELIAWLKSNPKVSAGTAAVGPRLVTAVFQRETGMRLAVAGATSPGEMITRMPTFVTSNRRLAKS